MKIAVMGGTGLIGSRVVQILNDSGHEALPHSLLEENCRTPEVRSRESDEFQRPRSKE